MPSGSTITLEKNLASSPKVEHAIGLEKSLLLSSKVESHISYSPATQFLGIYPRKTCPCSTGYMDKNDHSSIVHNSKNLEMT